MLGVEVGEDSRWRNRGSRIFPTTQFHHPAISTITRTTPAETLSTMTEHSIKSLFSSAERQRQDIESSWDTNTATYQQNVAAAITTYDDCLKLADRLSLFSPNETLEDITSGDLQYGSMPLITW